MGTVMISPELADELAPTATLMDHLRRALGQAARLTAENLEREAKGLPPLVRYGPPAPSKAWVIDGPAYLSTLDPPALLAEAQRLHDALAGIAGDGSGSDDYYVGDLVTEACEAIGRRAIVPGE